MNLTHGLTEEFLASHKIALEALAKMAAECIPPSPKNFSIWFAYFSHLHPELSRAIDIMSLGEAAPNQDQMDQLYDNFLHEKVAEETAITQVSARLHDNLAKVQSMIREAGTTASQFSTTLSGATEKLQDAGEAGSEDLRALLAQLAEDARMTLAQNEALQHRLAESSQELSDMRQDLASVREEAMTDALTGISNRKAFDMRLLQAAAETTENQQPLCLLIVDIDFFKKFNDTHGHQAGDQIIRLVAQTFKNGLKGQDTAARYGGEEFGLILPNTAMDNAIRVAEILRRTVEHKEVVNRATQEKLGQITISVGVAQYTVGESLEHFIERADAALYRAKQNGRNRVEVDA